MFSNASSPSVNQKINSTNYGNKMVKIDLTKNVLYPNNKNINSNDEKKYEGTEISGKYGRVKRKMISNSENEHLRKSSAGFHIEANSIFISLDSNTDQSTIIKNKNIPVQQEQSQFRNNSDNNHKNFHENIVKKIENFSLGTGLCMKMKKIKSKMFFAVRDRISYEKKMNGKNLNQKTYEDGGDQKEVEKEEEKVLHLEYPIFEMIGGGDDGMISLQNNVLCHDNDNSNDTNNCSKVDKNDDSSNYVLKTRDARPHEFEEHSQQLIPPSVPHTDIIHLIAHQIDIGNVQTSTSTSISLTHSLTHPLTHSLTN